MSIQEPKPLSLENEKLQSLLGEPGIRFAGFIDGMGNLVYGGIREGVIPLEDEHDRKKLYMELVLRVSTRREFDQELGAVEFSASKRTKVNMISFPFSNKILLVSTEPDVPIENTTEKIKKIFEI